MPSSAPIESSISSTSVPESNSITKQQTSTNSNMSNGAEKKSSQSTKAAKEVAGATDASGRAAEEKLSNAEKKKRKQDEKAARRAEVKGVTEQPIAIETQKSKKTGGAESEKKAGSTSSQAAPGTKSQQKAAAPGQKTIPLRPASASEKPVVTQPAKESKRVALFGHLYGHPRRTTLVGASKDVHPAVLALGLQLSSYIICGSSARCVAMLLTFKRVIESYVTPPGHSLTRHLPSHLSSQIEYLVSCRPISISMGNAITWLKKKISKVDIATPESEAIVYLCDIIDNFIRERITYADEVIAKTASEKIQNGDVILTFAKSNIVQQTLVQAYNKGTKFKVIVVDSRPLFEGKNIAQSLVEIGLEVQYALTHSIGHCMKEATKVFLGAHSMMSNGRLYSRVGSAIVAMMAKESDVPVIVCCESIKFTEKVALDSIVRNEVAPPDELRVQARRSTALEDWRDSPNLQLLNLMYDVTPAEYINMIITEYGSLPPTSVPVVHRLSTET